MRVDGILGQLVRVRPQPIDILNRLVYHLFDKFANSLPVSNIQLVVFECLTLAYQLRLNMLLALALHIGLPAIEFIHIEHF